jgi:hypothetical protein
MDVLWETDGGVAQVVHVQPQVHACALGAAMGEEISDGLQGSALPQQMDGERVPQAVRSLVRDRECARPHLERVGDRRGQDRSGGSADAQEDFATRQVRVAVAQVVEQGSADLLRQGKHDRRLGLRSRNSDPPRTPRNIVQAQCGDLARAQAVRGDEQEHRVVASPLRRRSIDGGEECLHGLPGKRARKLLAAVEPWRVDRAVEPAGNLVPTREEAEEGPQLRDRVLEARSTDARPHDPNELLDLSRTDAPKHCVIAVEAEEREQLRSHGAGLRRRRVGQPAHPTEVGAVGDDHPLVRRDHGPCEQTLLFEVLRERADQGRQVLVAPREPRHEREQSREREGSESMNPTPAQPSIKARCLPDTQADRKTWVSLRAEPNDEPFDVRPQQGQGREPSVEPRIDLGKHRDTPSVGASSGAIASVRGRLMWSRCGWNRAAAPTSARASHNQVLNMSRLMWSST